MGRQLQSPVVGTPLSTRIAAAAAASAAHGQRLEEAFGKGDVLSDDVVFLVGESRKPYKVSGESLSRNSEYFKNLLSKRRPPMPPIVMDCEESLFEGLLMLMRYGAWEALPPLSQSQAFRLKREAELYGVHYLQPSKTPDGTPSALDGSPKLTDATANARPPPLSRRLSVRHHDGVRLSGSTTRQLTELPGFPLDLADPTKLVLFTSLDEEKAAVYACEHCTPTSVGSGRPRAAAQWALNFHHRHVFCTACGQSPIKMAPKYYAEMFTGVAAQYNDQSAAHEVLQAGKPAANYRIRSDSTCLLRLVSSPACGPDACSSATCSAGAAHPDTVWAVTFFYCHAFCTRCGESADSPILVSLLLALRYGGSSTKDSSKLVGRSSFKSIPDS